MQVNCCISTKFVTVIIRLSWLESKVTKRGMFGAGLKQKKTIEWNSFLWKCSSWLIRRFVSFPTRKQ
ncbi:hypothetical protein AAW12_19040 [Sphingobacterium sp. Ag1]|nr:hypothetical protein AAW12_19040 [Sphingobacterium sp. Ag1]